MLSDKQQFAILRQRPHLIFHNELQFINVVTDLVKVRNNFVVVSNGQLTNVLNAIDHLTLFNHFLHVFSNKASVAVNLIDQVNVVSRQILHPFGV